jgi:hypothetical protein
MFAGGQALASQPKSVVGRTSGFCFWALSSQRLTEETVFNIPFRGRQKKMGD